MEDGWPTARYMIGSVLNWLMFLTVVALMWWGEVTGRLPDLVQWPLVLLLGTSVAVQFIVAYRSVAAQDEFVRALTFKRGIAAAGLTLTAAVLWGLAEQFLDAPKVPMWFIYPFFSGATGIVTPIIRTSRA